MRVWLSRIDPKSHRFRVERPGHPPIDRALETRSLLLHDLAHYAVEGELQTEHGFFGLLAAGADPADLREHRVPEEEWARLMALERQVARLQTAFKRGLPHDAPEAWARLRSAHGAWSKVRQGQALLLHWPAAAPEVVTDPP